MLNGFICDTCGFTSAEEVGTGNTYYCPKCGNQMRRAIPGGMFGRSDPNSAGSVILADIFYIIFVGGLSFGIMNYISYWTDDLLDIILLILWIILFVYSLIFFHKKISGSVSNKAIRKNPNRNNTMATRTINSNTNVNTPLYCSNCGQKLQKNQKFCSNCGNPIEK